MLQTSKSPLSDPATVASGSPEFFSTAYAFVRRQYPIIGIVTSAALALGVLYLLNTPAAYTAQATMIIDTRKASVFQQSSALGDLPLDSALVESQVEILRSENIATAVIKDLHLTEDPEFVGPGGGLLGAAMAFVSGMVSGPPVKSEADLMRSAIRVFASQLAVRRVGLTYIIELRFRARDPVRAAAIANAVADAYVVDQLDAKYKATQRASTWLQDRIRELREQTSESERAVVDFKSKNGIVNAGGRSMNDQQVSEVNSQLVLAKAQTAEAKARLDRVAKIVNSEVPDATVTDTLKNDVITKLRQQYLELKAREADWSMRYGPTHLATVQLRNQMFQIRQSILDELKRIGETYKSDYEIAQQREKALESGLARAVDSSQSTSQAEVALHELESAAQSYKTLYNNFLQRYMESVQQQTFPISEARVITFATPPANKSEPRASVVLGIASALGLILGLAIAKFREVSDRVFRTTQQLESALQTRCLGIVPDLTASTKSAPKLKVASRNKKLNAIPTSSGNVVPLRGERIISRTADPLWNIVDHPFSRATESMRAVKVAADLSGTRKIAKILGVTSALPKEGKSTIAGALAQVIALGGSRVLLIDADLRNPSLTRRLAPQADCGLVELCNGSLPLSSVAWSDPSTGLTFIPSVVQGNVAHTHEILSSKAMKDLFEQLRSEFDYVIVDLSPLAPIVDVKAAAHLVDTFVFIVQWGQTKIDIVEHALFDASGVYENLLGVVLNRADIDVLERYDSYKSGYYQNKYYQRYGYTD